MKKGDRLVYTGDYDKSVPDDARYPPGTVVGFRNYKTVVTVQLDNGRYADWPVKETKKENANGDDRTP